MKKTLIMTTMLLASLAALTATETTTARSPAKLACIGDSITAGVGANLRPAMSYPSQLGRMLGTNHWKVGNFGISASTLMNTPASKRVWRSCAMAKVVAFAPDVVIINLGINDCQPGAWASKAEFLPTYRALLNDLRALPSKPKILICRPTPPDHKKQEVRWAALTEMLPMMDQLAKEEHLQLVDFHGALTGHEDLFRDGLHPNNAGAEIMARTAYQVLIGKPFEGAVPAVPPQEANLVPEPRKRQPRQ